MTQHVAHRASDEVATLLNALRYLADCEARYRLSYEQRGSGDMQTGRAWDAMRKAGDRARAILKAAGIETFSLTRAPGP